MAHKSLARQNLPKNTRKECDGHDGQNVQKINDPNKKPESQKATVQH